MRRLGKAVVVVTGASSGIGRATAEAFAREGATVLLAARRQAPLEEAAAACREHGATAVAVPTDVTDPDAVEALAREAVQRFGRLDVWVNNAAVHQFASVEEAPPEEWHRVVETNLFGAYHGLRAALPWFREQGSGVAVNVSSVLGKMGSPYQSAYVASKHGLRALSDCARQELDDLAAVHVCTVLPGPVDTPLFDNAANRTGWAVKPLKPVLDAHRVADAIVTCARRPRREVVVGGVQRDVLGLKRLAPGLLERLASRRVDKDHFGDSPAPPRAGNVLAPARGVAAGISGGWSRTGVRVGTEDRRAASANGHRRRLPLLVAATAGAAGVTAIARSRR